MYFLVRIRGVSNRTTIWRIFISTGYFHAVCMFQISINRKRLLLVYRKCQSLYALGFQYQDVGVIAMATNCVPILPRQRASF